MTIANSAIHRGGWQARLTFTSRAIDDLRSEITIALQAQPDLAAMQLLVEADFHLELAQKELLEASKRIDSIQ